jgi:hypothetical protein
MSFKAASKKSNVSRPTKKNAQAIARILKVARTGLPLKFAAQAGDISDEALSQWRAKDPEFNRALSQARLTAVEERWKLIKRAAEGYKDNPPDWRAAAWALERTFAAEFARPEFQLNLQTNSVTQNFLSISISGSEAKSIEAEAGPIRERVAQMISQYRPTAFGNGDGRVQDVEATPTSAPIQQPAEPAVIEHKAGDEKRQAFWRMLVSSDPETALVARETALFVSGVILRELLGFRAKSTPIEFDDDPVRLADMFALLERLAEAWQLMQRKAGYS